MCITGIYSYFGLIIIVGVDLFDSEGKNRNSVHMTQDEAWLLQEKYDGVASPLFFTDCARLNAGEPLAYIIGHLPFAGCTISLDTKPLIPRAETEYWITEVNGQYEKMQVWRVLDLCAGSGCIGIAFAAQHPLALVDLVEIDAAHHDLILKNCARNSIAAERVQVFGGSLFSALPADTRYDVIVSNPPYIDKSLGRVAADVVAHEPALALYGGDKGLEIIATIIANAASHLEKGGSLWLEHEPEQTASIHKEGASCFSVTTHKDQYEVERFSQLVLQ